ncbi:nicotinate-nucleotide adenylyltransferase [Tahibacter amnicola]|uniref:Probable nicotinate-nucleotide adenylyltransferase n=1 Tax=Tahibacter amnicola TaxID=2976241 RepID=A0ABY6BLJ9_9GAMM|nr:nicotinate-nucleotide adenylyltransferase [Tahibacter amnicola]UXI69920.1 nicotinate-nucleotide adenylyltransferase [Tahibacter amnicola]
MSDASAAPIALMGGTFDPVHNGHLRAAWEASAWLGARVRLMPANVPPHRPQPQAPAAARAAMLRLALHGQERLVVDDRELRRDSPSFTVDTLRELRAEVGARHPLVLLVGEDAFAGLASWREWRELFALTHFGVMTRPGHEPAWPGELQAEVAGRECALDGDWRSAPAGFVLRLDVTALEISATAIRQQLAVGEEPRYLVPEAVLAAIRAEGWYTRRA